MISLGNRPATCNAYYVHPAIPEAYLAGSLLPVMERAEPAGPAPEDLRAEEVAVLSILARQTKVLLAS